MAASPDMLTVGQVARQAGVGVQTVRFYEREGVLRKASRTSSGYRKFPAETVRLVRFVKRAQALGFSLDEIRELLRLRQAKGSRCVEVRKVASAQKSRIEEKIARLEQLKGALETLLASCGRRDSELDCPILESLDDKA